MPSAVKCTSCLHIRPTRQQNRTSAGSEPAHRAAAGVGRVAAGPVLADLVAGVLTARDAAAVDGADVVGALGGGVVLAAVGVLAALVASRRRGVSAVMACITRRVQDMLCLA